MEILVMLSVLFLWITRDYLENRVNYIMSERSHL